jgi:Domain of unknown function (DUF4159)/Aerotolerance regulator N-terminal
MWTIGSFAFVEPLILLALAGLPVLWWLLRQTPPAPQRLRFPAIRLLFDLIPKEETPHKTPWWLILFRMVVAAALIVALAHPLINPLQNFAGNGPLLLAVDNGWAAAPHWQERQAAMEEWIERADRQGLPVQILATSPAGDGQPIALSGTMAASDAKRVAQEMTPQPWPTDRAAAQRALSSLPTGASYNVVWLTDGVGTGKNDASAEFAARLGQLGNVTVLRNAPEDLALLLLPPPIEPGAFDLRIARPQAGPGRQIAIRATGSDGRLIAREEMAIASGETLANHRMRLPAEMRNRIARLDIEGQSSAGAAILLDEGWRQRPVGLVGQEEASANQPLLGDLFYLERALAPFAELHRGNIDTLVQSKLAVLVLADVGTLSDAELQKLKVWVEKGGVLLRFAGNWLAQKPDDLLPVQLRGTDRAMGGAMSWSEPLTLSAFPQQSPFAGLPVPTDVVVRRQVLAEPDINLGDKTWARLSDGTPLVTGARRGNGWVVLVHTTANADWSTLALSGLFVQMLQRLIALSQGVADTESAEALPPLQTLDGLGRLGTPPAAAIAATAKDIETGAIGPRHPPGYYGHGDTKRALNLAATIKELKPLAALPVGMVQTGYTKAEEVDLKYWLLAAVMALLAVDLIISLALRGLLRPRRIAAAASAASLILFLAAGNAAAQETADDFALKAVSQTHLAYVHTGIPEVDATSRAGLIGLTFILNDRTAVEAGEPIGVDIENDELAFFPLLYWPISPEQPSLSDRALSRLNTYMKNGGIIVFDTLDQNSARAADVQSVGPGLQRLRDIGHDLDIPPLVPVPPDHVLTRSFYLMQAFPGRWADGQVWVEQGQDRVNDGVSSVIIGGNDWASAWALDDNQRPMFATVPGGERQREMAYRFGVNLVMYALTGNYKSDQVHVPAILERLGQ